MDAIQQEALEAVVNSVGYADVGETLSKYIASLEEHLRRTSARLFDAVNHHDGFASAGDYDLLDSTTHLLEGGKAWSADDTRSTTSALTGPSA